MKYCLVGDRTSIHLKKWESYLHEQGHETYYVDTSGGQQGGSESNIISIKFDRMGKLLIFFQMLRVAWFVLKNQIKVVDVHYVGLNSVVSFLTLGAMRVATCHGSDIHTDPYRSRLLRWATWIELLRANLIFVSGRPLSQELKKIYPTIDEKKIIPYSPGVNLDVFRTCSRGTKKYDFISTRLMQEKYAILQMIEGLIKLKQIGFVFKVALVVTKPNATYLELIKTKISQALSDEVDFFPELPQEKIATLYNASAFSLHFPYGESIGLSVIESTLCDCFPITLGHAAYMDYMDANDMIIARSVSAADLMESMKTALQGDFRVSQSLKQRLAELHSSPTNYMRNLALISAARK